MVFLISILSKIFTVMIPVFAAGMQPGMIARAPSFTTTTSVTLGTASGGALDALATRPPSSQHLAIRPPKLDLAEGADDDLLTINIINSLSVSLSIFYGSNVGAPTPIGDPGPGTLVSSTQILLPSDWAGRVTIGDNYDPKGSKIEASFSPPDYVPDVDISYVDGYSVPISCSCSGVTVAGCNISLFNTGNTCTNFGNGPICYNDEEDVPNGPASPFFAPCQGAAYTYPNDNAANSYGQCDDRVIDCCVGPQCPGPERQMGKRGLSYVARRWGW